MYTCIFKRSHTSYSLAHLKRLIDIGKHICLQLFFRFGGILRGYILHKCQSSTMSSIYESFIVISRSNPS